MTYMISGLGDGELETTISEYRSDLERELYLLRRWIIAVTVATGVLVLSVVLEWLWVWLR